LAVICCGGAQVPAEAEQVHGLHVAVGGMTRAPCPWYATTGASAGQLGAFPAGPDQNNCGSEKPSGAMGTQTPEHEGPASATIASPPSAMLASSPPSGVEPSGQGSLMQCPGQGSISQQASRWPLWAKRPSIG
jgi:hypothetical protein